MCGKKYKHDKDPEYKFVFDGTKKYLVSCINTNHSFKANHTNRSFKADHNYTVRPMHFPIKSIIIIKFHTYGFIIKIYVFIL